MGKIADTTLKHINGEQIPEAFLQQQYEKHHDQLIKDWTGTKDKPGALSRILLAGLAAGDAGLKVGSAVNPNRPVALKAELIPGTSQLLIDWNLENADAIAFIRQYALNLIKRLDKTTTDNVRKMIERWLIAGDSMDVLRDDLKSVLKDSARADAIAQTESTRAYFEGAKVQYKEAGIKTGRWKTVNVGLKGMHDHPGDVCPICAPLHSQEGDLDQGWWSEVLGQYVFPPAHVNCRCWVMPKAEYP